MGVRVNMYAVDAPRFVAFIDQPIRTVLSYCIREAEAPSWMVCCYDEARRVRYGVHVKRKIIIVNDGATGYEAAADDAFLAGNYREYLSKSRSSELLFLLGGLAGCPSCEFVAELIEGVKLGWIEQLIDAAQTDAALAPSDRAKLASLLTRILRSWSRDPIASDAAGLKDCDLPVPPDRDDDGPEMAIWTSPEARFVAAMLRGLKERECRRPIYGPGRRSLGVNPGPWDPYLHEVVVGILALESVWFQDLRCVSFIR